MEEEQGLKSVEGYLEQLAVGGALWDRGEFTIDPRRATEKLSQFQLSEPGLWVVKIVQAAVAAGSSGIEFTFHRKKVEVTFGNTAGWRASEILSLLGRGLIPARSDFRHFFAGLLAGSQGFTQEFSWSCGGERVRLDGAQASKDDIADDQLVHLSIASALSPRDKANLWTAPLRYALTAAAFEHGCLVKYLVTCPIEIKVDCYWLNRRYLTLPSNLPTVPGFDSDSAQGRNLPFAQWPLPLLTGPKTLAYPLCDRVPVEIDSRRPDFRTIIASSPEAMLSGVLCLYSCLQRQSRVNFVLDGALIENGLLYSDPRWANEELSMLQNVLEDGVENFSLDLYLAVSSDQCDLSQFALIDTEVVTRAIPAIAEGLWESVNAISQDCQKPWHFWEKNSSTTQWLNASLGDLAGTAFLLALAVPLASLLVVGVPVLWATRSWRDKRNGKELFSRVEEIKKGLLLWRERIN